MNLILNHQLKKQMTSKKLEKRRKQRVLEEACPTAQKSLKYTSQFKEGLMHIVGDEYSKMYRLGDLDYETADEEEQEQIALGCAEGLNTLDKKSRYQLLVINKAKKNSLFEEVRFPFEWDDYDVFRQEINEINRQGFESDQRNFEIEKYAIFTTQSRTRKQASQTLDKIATKFQGRFKKKGVKLKIEKLEGLERLKVTASLLKPKSYFTVDYEDIMLSGLTSKAFVSPNRFKFPRNKTYFRVGDKYATVLYANQYPKYLEDELIRELCKSGIELAISLHGKPYEMVKARKAISTVKALNKAAIQKQQRENFHEGVGEDMISGEAAEIEEATTELIKEFQDRGQKYFSGIFAVYLLADSKAELKQKIKTVEDAAATWQVSFDYTVLYHEEALNTILPIGKPYLDVEKNFMRDMTTANLATQIPFTTQEFQSSTGVVYGKNQRSHNLIVIDRKEDLITPSGLVLGSSGAGKGMLVKWEIINVLLKYPNRRIIIVDPEGEYTPIAQALGGVVLYVSTGTSCHLNLLDLPDKALLDKEDQEVDYVKEKTNLLVNLFKLLLQDFGDIEKSIVDEYTQKLFANFENQKRQPTLKDWYALLNHSNDEEVLRFAKAVRPYTVGSQDIFAHDTNVDLSSRLVVFNTKKLDPELKLFANKVIYDQIWKEIVKNQHKVTTHLYFDEIQANFDRPEDAQFFMNIWARVRKYGAIPTGITQSVLTLLESEYGQNMILNTEFIVLLRQKLGTIKRLEEVLRLTDPLKEYIQETAPQGTGLIYAGGTVIPFENPIPEQTQLFEIMNTNAKGV
ncbi:hypothetical protein M2256_001663 [Lactococcus lactis]|uniref:TraG P-loop domain-containing protein n=2 Tax=Lactococcus lactis TaxID=1358 RepID=A0AAW5TPG7_9LACT|nr:DUF87 domain-containing protein [Lactococcus lactis]MCW2281205.1 hypothetical protein [Lactococcus lactis]